MKSKILFWGTALLCLLAVLSSNALGDLNDGLVARWSFDNPVDTGHDDSGNGHNGTVNGAVSVDGVYGKALSFDGIDDYVDIGSSDLGTNFSVNMWVNLNSAPSTDSKYLMGIDSFVAGGFSFGVSSGSNVRFTDNIVTFVDSTGTCLLEAGI